MEKVKLSNEIISSIARTYQYISRIDIQADYFEEINNRDTEHLKFTKSGKLSESNEKVCRQYVAEEYQEAFFKFVDLKTLPERMKNEETLVLEYRMKDGDWHRLRFVEKKRDENGVLTHVLCLIRSISDTKKWEHELMYQVEEARKAAALKARFLSNMSHDIRTPINGICGMIDVAEHYADDMEKQTECRAKIKETSHLLLELINEVLDMSKLESDEVVLEEIPFNLSNISKEIFVVIEQIAAEENIRIVWEKEEITHWNLIGSPGYVKRIMMNILSNAVKYNKENGYIYISCQEFTSEQEGRVTIEFICRDTGIGMTKDFQKRLFEPFAQEHTGSRTKFSGTGLGMPITKKLIEKMGGTITFESKKGEGTTFVIRIPFKIDQDADQREEQEAISEKSIKDLKILLVEDNELNVEIAEMLLEDQGAQVMVVADGQQAVDRFVSEPPGTFDVIDMRGETEIAHGAIPGSVAIPEQELLENPPENTGKKLIIVCSRGRVSVDVSEELCGRGYEAYSLEGGYIGWLMSEMKKQEAEEICESVEKSIRKKFHKSIWSNFTKAVRQYELVKEGDKVAVCISGGKDSMLMAKLFQELLKHGKANFELVFLVMNPGYNEDNWKIIQDNAKVLGIPLTVFETQIFDTVADIDKNPCYLCARMRRGYLYSHAKELGCNKIALGHHFDDVIETILMGMLYGAQVQTMMPKLHSTNFPGMELIRPLYLVREEDIIHWMNYNDLHFIQCACRFTESCASCGGTEKGSKRAEIKDLIRELRKKNPYIEKNIFRSVENVNLNTVIGYKKDGVRHHFLDEYDKA